MGWLGWGLLLTFGPAFIWGLGYQRGKAQNLETRRALEERIRELTARCESLESEVDVLARPQPVPASIGGMLRRLEAAKPETR